MITAVNGKTVTSTEGFIATVDSYNAGQTITLTVKRDGQTQARHGDARHAPASTPSGG